jgi:hypothetical protein
MRRIRTAFFKKINRRVTIDYVLELVESNTGTYYLLENVVDYGKGVFTKTELFKSHTDQEEIADYFDGQCRKKLKEKYSLAENGETFNHLKFLLDHSEQHINKAEQQRIVENVEEMPRLIRL